MMEDKLMQLVEKWREEADEIIRGGDDPSTDSFSCTWDTATANTFRVCADELEQSIKEATE
jgi:hypothetical protein